MNDLSRIFSLLPTTIAILLLCSYPHQINSFHIRINTIKPNTHQSLPSPSSSSRPSSLTRHHLPSLPIATTTTTQHHHNSNNHHHRIPPTSTSTAAAASSALIQNSTSLLSLTLLLYYHIRLLHHEKNGTKKTWRLVQSNTRTAWSRYVRDTENWLYAIQTLRNAITANTFLATTVLSLLTVISGKMWDVCRSSSSSMATTTLSVGGGGISAFLSSMATISSSRRTRMMIAYGGMATCMLVSAYEFLQSARLMTHAGFMFPVTKHSSKVDEVMRKSQCSQWLGLRWLYVSLGFISWMVFGGWGFLMSSVGLVCFFNMIDKAPKGLEEEDMV